MIDDCEKVLKASRRLGFRGLAKSAYHSYRHTRSLQRVLIHPNVLTLISSDADIDIRSRLLMGFRTRHNASHRKLGKSKLFVAADGQLTASSTNGSAIIGPCSVLHIDGGEFSMGDSYINAEAKILCSESIHIGDRCAIAWGVTLSDSNFHSLTVDGKEKTKTKPIEIQDHVWIGNNVNVKKGVTIGEGAVIGSNSLVTSNIPAGSLAVGSPAEVISEDVEW